MGVGRSKETILSLVERWMVFIYRAFRQLLTWYAVSNESYINRVIMDVLPTPWSPRNTSLYLANGVICLFSGSILPAPAEVVEAAAAVGSAASAII